MWLSATQLPEFQPQVCSHMPRQTMNSLHSSYFNCGVIDRQYYISFRYMTVIWLRIHFQMWWNCHHNNPNYHLSPYKINAILLTMVPMVYVIAPWFLHFIAGGLYFLIPFILLLHRPTTTNHLPPPRLATTNLFSVSMSIGIVLFVLFFNFHIIMQYFPFYDFFLLP